MRSITWSAMEPLLGVFCFFVTFFLVGVWHGRTSEFIFFGVLRGAGVALNKLWQMGMARTLGRRTYKGLARNSVYSAFGRGLTFSWFAFSLFWFWGSWKQIDEIFSAQNVIQWLGVWLAILICATAALAVWEWLLDALLSIKVAEESVFKSRYAGVVYASALGLAVLVITALLHQCSRYRVQGILEAFPVIASQAGLGSMTKCF